MPTSRETRHDHQAARIARDDEGQRVPAIPFGPASIDVIEHAANRRANHVRRLAETPQQKRQRRRDNAAQLRKLGLYNYDNDR